MDKIKEFRQREEVFNSTASGLNKQYNTIAAVRITVFLVTIVLIVLFANMRMAEGIVATILAFPFVFGLIVKNHNRIAAKRDLAKYSAKVNEDEISRLEHKLSSLDGGEVYKDKTHPYTGDLDVFGKNSLYQLVSRAVTPSGKDTIARWLSTPADKPEIELRQESVREITPLLDWRQKFQASGMNKEKDEANISLLLEWINEPNRVLGNKVFRALAIILPIITVTLIALYFFTDLSFYYAGAFLAINALILKKFAEYVENITEKTFKNIRTLQAFGRMIKCIEDSSFESQKLTELQKVFLNERSNASASIIQLQKILDYLQARSNMFYLFFNFALLFDLHLVFRAEKWKTRQKADVNQWFEHIGEFEALNSLAGMAYANPDFTMPTISTDEYVFVTKQLGHPLIPAHERVNNSITMKNKGTVNIITGSNMSGKSTFLRTVAINIVLGLAGGPVCAQEMEVSRLQVFTSMRTEDNLEEHVSSFYAELKRIRMLLDMLQKPEIPVLYMLDEILKGTNSRDRHAGASALIRQVSKTDSMGFVSTHDLELGQLSNELSGVHNYSFNSIVEGDEIIFNYTLEDGICHSFNASKLMEKIGIEMKMV